VGKRSLRSYKTAPTVLVPPSTLSQARQEPIFGDWGRGSGTVCAVAAKHVVVMIVIVNYIRYSTDMVMCISTSDSLIHNRA
jgi:hypothetical protein